MKKIIVNNEITLYLLLGFLISYSVFFLPTVFFAQNSKMRFVEYVPVVKTIGNDLKTTISYSIPLISKNKFIGEDGRSFPPFAQLFFFPMLFLKFNYVYLLWVIITLLSFLYITFWIPMRLSRNSARFSTILFFLLTGIFSYGLQFELERGQFNVFTFFLVISSFYIYHFHRKLKLIAYCLFAASVNFKLYPAVFAFMFIDDPKRILENAIRIVGLWFFSFCLFFITGIEAGANYLKIIAKTISEPIGWWTNHSARGFLWWIPDKLDKFVSKEAIRNNPLLNVFPDLANFIKNNSDILSLLLMSLVAIGLFFVFWHVWKENTSSINPYLPVLCTIICLIVPSQSQDYKLSVMPWGLSIFFATLNIQKKSFFIAIVQKLLIVFIGFLYSALLYSKEYKYYFIENNFLIIIALYFSIIIFMVINENYIFRQIELNNNP